MKSFKRWFKKFLLSSLGIVLISMSFSGSAFALISDNSSVSSTTVLDKINGQYNTLGSEPSPVIAVNSSRVFELLNNQYYIIDRGSSSGFSGSANQLTHNDNVYLTDPQVMWDPISSRFYYSYAENNNSGEHGISWGFSKIANPSSAADFCSYFSVFNYGTSSYPDKQSLGDNRHFLFFASERVALPSHYDIGSNVDWYSKPPVGSTCPSQRALANGIESLTNSGPTGSESVTQPQNWPYYPVVAKQVDTNPTTWIVGLPSGVSANYLNVIQVSTGSNGLPVFGQTNNLPVPTYSAVGAGEVGVQGGVVPQEGSNYNGPAPSDPTLEVWVSLNGMYMAFDPRLGHYALWTTDTIAGNTPLESAVRWYELFPGGNTLDQSGTISSPTLDYFNSAIAPDRAVIYGTGKAYGSDMAITFNSSSATSYPAMWYEAKAGALQASSPILLKQSLGTYTVSNCSETNEPNTCRYGDWPGAAPDPLAITSKYTTGRVWVSNEWNIKQTSATGSPTWRTLLAEIGFN